MKLWCVMEYSCVVVYTKELEYVIQIGSPVKGPGKLNDICDLSTVEHGNLYYPIVVTYSPTMLWLLLSATYTY